MEETTTLELKLNNERLIATKWDADCFEITLGRTTVTLDKDELEKLISVLTVLKRRKLNDRI